ncbi:MAG: hypothetical protein LBV30_10020 [Propionibacteriaceae bacterium]|jgi:hypothetical protein|nr:hypothetical protein [Propionibacteriaceae bacterium]
MPNTPTKRSRRDRYDASFVPPAFGLNALFPYLMKGRNESFALFPMTIDMEPLLAYIAAKKGTDQEISLFESFMLALVKVLRQSPSLNRYIIGRRMYQRRNVVLSFIARKKYVDNSQETNVLVSIKPDDDRATILSKLRGEIRVAKAEDAPPKDDDKLIGEFLKLPRGLLRVFIKLLEWWDFYRDTPKFLRGVDPLRGSAYIANVGSVGLDAAYHHMFEWGTCSLFVVIGKVEPKVMVGQGNVPVVKQAVNVKVTLDERIADGYIDAKALTLLETYLADPAQLEW